jgi:hypothetical protein
MRARACLRSVEPGHEVRTLDGGETLNGRGCGLGLQIVTGSSSDSDKCEE